MKKERRLSMDGAALLDNNNLYFAIGNGNGLFCYDLQDRHLQYLGSFPSESKVQCELYHSAVKYNNYLLFPPHYANKFAVYDMKKNIFENWNFLPRMKNKAVGRAVLYQDKMYICGTWVNPYILMVDLKNGKAVFHKDWMDNIHPEGRRERVHISTTGANQNQQNLFFTGTTSKGAEVICLNMENNTIERIKLPIYPDNFQWVYATAYGNDSKIWAVIDEDGKILEIDRRTQGYTLYDTWIDKTARRNSFLRIFQEQDSLIMIPYMANRIVKMNINTGLVSVLYCEEDKEITEYGKAWGKYSWIDYKDGVLYLFRRYNCSLKIVDLLKNKTEEVVFYDKEKVSRMYVVDGGNFYQEKFTVNNKLEFYIGDICDRICAESAYTSVNYGEKIYNAVMEGGSVAR